MRSFDGQYIELAVHRGGFCSAADLGASAAQFVGLLPRGQAWPCLLAAYAGQEVALYTAIAL